VRSEGEGEGVREAETEGGSEGAGEGEGEGEGEAEAESSSHRWWRGRSEREPTETSRIDEPPPPWREHVDDSSATSEQRVRECCGWMRHEKSCNTSS
jgi:hypothetical protein